MERKRHLHYPDKQQQKRWNQIFAVLLEAQVKVLYCDFVGNHLFIFIHNPFAFSF